MGRVKAEPTHTDPGFFRKGSSDPGEEQQKTKKTGKEVGFITTSTYAGESALLTA